MSGAPLLARRHFEPAGIPWLRRGWEAEPPKPEPMMRYDFPLRKGMLISVTLPLHLSKADAERISAFVSILPFRADKGYFVNLESE